MLGRTAPIYTEDQRALSVLAQREDGFGPRAIAKRLALPEDIVDTILAEDARAFPSEPLLRRRA